jgi:hypothetical protein
LPGLEGQALIAWIATAGVGLSLLGIWFERGGMRRRGARRITPHLLFTHIAPAVTGLFLWIAFLVSDSASLAWMAFGILVVVAVVGSTNFYIWQRRRVGLLRATQSRWDLGPTEAADERIPAEQHFPVGAVVLHGLLALTTVALVLVSALDAGTEESGARSPVTTGPAASISSTGATLQGTTGGAKGPARFQYGVTPRRGFVVRAPSVGGDAVSAQLTGLLPGTLYHYRLVVGRGQDARLGTDRTFVTLPPRRVRVRAVSLAPRRARIGRSAKLRFLLDAPATVRVGVYRVRARPLRLRRVATVVLDGRAGPNAFDFGTRPEVSALPPGRYRAVLVASVAGGRPSAPRRLGFRLVGR